MTRTAWVLSAAIVVAAVTVAGAVADIFRGSQATAAAARPPASTAEVEKRTLSATVSESGILTFRARADGSPYTVIDQARGTYTKLPAVGHLISQGHVLYRVNNSPVALLHGSTPAYRPLSAGATGPDVAELNADLVALGYASSTQLSRASASFGAATTRAVERLQAALGMPQDGTLALGQVVFEPTDVRVTTLSAQPGGSAQPGRPVLEGTSTSRQVQVALDASQQTEVAVRNKVTITLPNNRTTPGVVTSVATVATCPASSAAGGPGSSAAPTGTDACSSGGSGSSSPTITVDVAFSHSNVGGKWDQAPVQVGITTASVPNALTVPVAALLARSGGGYAVEVEGAGTRATNHLVPVSLGLFDDGDGLVQVGGSGLAAGQRVVVPST